MLFKILNIGLLFCDHQTEESTQNGDDISRTTKRKESPREFWTMSMTQQRRRKRRRPAQSLPFSLWWDRLFLLCGSLSWMSFFYWSNNHLFCMDVHAASFSTLTAKLRNRHRRLRKRKLGGSRNNNNHKRSDRQQRTRPKQRRQQFGADRDPKNEESCQDLIDSWTSDDDRAVCTCDDSQGPEVLILSCTYPECSGESCVEDDFLGSVCADIVLEEYTFRQNPNTGFYEDVAADICAQFVSGRSETICFYEEYDPVVETNYTCSIQVNEQFCNRCDDCILDCTNIEITTVGGGRSADLIDDECADDYYDDDYEEEFPSNSLFVILNDQFFAPCFGEIVENPDGTISYVIADPHIQTYDGVQYDCQAAGEFILTQSATYFTTTTNPRMMIQGRFTRIPNTPFQATITTALVSDLNGFGPIQVSLSQQQQSPSTCVPNFYYNSDRINPIQDVVFSLGDSGTSLSADILMTNTEIRIDYKPVGLQIRLLRRSLNAFGGCFFSTLLYIPPQLLQSTVEKGGIIGLYGSPNGDPTDDWMDRNGNLLPVPDNGNSLRFEPAYNYCSTFWCLRNEIDSLFTYSTPSESFDMLQKCNDPYDGSALENAINNPSNELQQICNSNNNNNDLIACLIDGFVGGTRGATLYVNDIEEVQAISDELVGNPGTRTPRPQPQPPTRRPFTPPPIRPPAKQPSFTRAPSSYRKPTYPPSLKHSKSGKKDYSGDSGKRHDSIFDFLPGKNKYHKGSKDFNYHVEYSNIFKDTKQDKSSFPEKDEDDDGDYYYYYYYYGKKSRLQYASPSSVRSPQQSVLVRGRSISPETVNGNHATDDRPRTSNLPVHPSHRQKNEEESVAEYAQISTSNLPSRPPNGPTKEADDEEIAPQVFRHLHCSSDQNVFSVFPCL